MIRREELVAQLTDRSAPFDMIVIGGGATGLGVAVDAASRGYATALVERHDFAKGTSSRSTKLIHGGVRYLQQGHLGLVVEALRERGLLTTNAKGLVRPMPFVVPNYTWWQAPFYGAGLKLYDTLAGRLGFGRSHHLSRAELLRRLPTLEPRGLRGGIVYYDGQFDDARLAIALMRTAVSHGAVCVNYAPVVGFTGRGGTIRGVVIRDEETTRQHEVAGRVVVNAAGIFADEVRRMAEADAESLLAPSQGVHLVLPREFLPGDAAVMVPRTDDGRVLFAIPWLGRVLVGTTDTPVADSPVEPQATLDEIEFLLGHAGRYLTRDPEPTDVLSVFAGVRPLVRGAATAATAALTRDHAVVAGGSGLITVVGGKWTTYRQMAEETVDTAALVGGLEDRQCRTRTLPILVGPTPPTGEPLHPRVAYSREDVVRAVRDELARSVEDVLARRSRALFTDARSAIELAPTIAAILSHELGRDMTGQPEAFAALADGYLVPGAYQPRPAGHDPGAAGAGRR